MEEMIFLTKEQVATRWAVTIRTVQRLVSEGQLTAYHFVGKLRFKVSDVVAFEESYRGKARTSLAPVAPPVQEPVRRGPKRKGSVVDFTGRQPRRKSA